MINEEVLGGLISALERGQSLKKSMFTLYTAGYTKEEVEEAARALMKLNEENPMLLQTKTAQPEEKKAPETAPQTPILKAPPKTFAELQASRAKEEPVQPKPVAKPVPVQPAVQLTVQPKKPLLGARVQKVSNYGVDEKTEKAREKAILLVLLVLLILLSGLLTMIFFFKNQLIEFLSTFIG
jgi:hypothetical protein